MPSPHFISIKIISHRYILLSYICQMSKSRQSNRKTSAKEAKKASSKAVSEKAAGETSKRDTRKDAARETRQEAPAAVKKDVPQALPEEKLPAVILDQSVAILIDGNNIEMSLHSVSGKKGAMINFDKLVPALLMNRALSRLIYFREGKSISGKLAERLQKLFHGSVVPCYKSADIPLTIKAVQVASKVDTIIILSGDADYVELVRHLKHDGIRVEIAAFPETSADVLLNEADYFFPITVDYSFELK